MTNDLVWAPGAAPPADSGKNNVRWNYMDPGQYLQYAPGYYANVRDGFNLTAHYTDESLYAAQRRALVAPKESLEQQMLLNLAGYLPKDEVTGMWGKAVNGAYAKAMSDANSMYMSLDEYLRLKAGLSGSGNRNGTGPSGPRTMTSVSRSVRITSRASAQSLLKQTLTNELGREPTAAEVAAFVRSLNKAERANPTVSTTTTTSTAKGSSSSTVTKESEIDPGSEAETYAEKVNPTEAHRYQSGNYYDVIARMVGE